MFGPHRGTNRMTTTWESKWAAMERKGSEEGWSTLYMKVEKEQLETGIYHIRFPKMHMASHASYSTPQIGSPDNFSTGISELLQRDNVKEAYPPSNEV